MLEKFKKTIKNSENQDYFLENLKRENAEIC
jgi:hypothetical protein